ncbi:unnamed protein product [Lymnaea stagnalis]|uniref:RING-type domain-containing protein n=1 Tax=Lymnaea stagnalis TaxID=6523 RepID=A0AAV2HJB1_LYMST
MGMLLKVTSFGLILTLIKILHMHVNHADNKGMDTKTSISSHHQPDRETCNVESSCLWSSSKGKLSKCPKAKRTKEFAHAIDYRGVKGYTGRNVRSISKMTQNAMMSSAGCLTSRKTPGRNSEPRTITFINVMQLVNVILSFSKVISLHCRLCDQHTLKPYFNTKVNLNHSSDRLIHSGLKKDISQEIRTFDYDHGDEKTKIDAFLNEQNFKDVHYKWLFEPRKLVPAVFERNITVFPAFQLVISRLASFRNIAKDFISTPLSSNRLSESGFRYSGSGSMVTCEECGREVELSSFIRGCDMVDPKDARFHNVGCSYATNEHNHDVDDAHTGTETDSAPHNLIARPVEKSLTISVTFPSVSSKHEAKDFHSPLANKQALNFASGGTPWDNSTFDRSFDGPPYPQTNTNPATVHPPVPEGTGQPHSAPEDADEASNQIVSGVTNGETSSSISGEASPAATDAIFFETELVTPEQATTNDVRHEGLHRTSCEKNPGHHGSYPMNQLTAEQIPSKTRHQDVLTFLQLLSVLTVRIVVNVTSSLHRKVDPSCANGNEPRFGTGFVSLAKEVTGDSPVGGSGQRKWGAVRQFVKSLVKAKSAEIRLETNRHLVFDDTEAANASAEFFFDRASARGVKVVKGVTVLHSNVIGDNRSILVCRTTDQSFVDQINQTIQQLLVLVQTLPARAKDTMCRKVFIISHPHGKEKVLSYGDSVQVKYAVNPATEKGRQVIKIDRNEPNFSHLCKPMKMLMYSADTCPGSCGGPVIGFKRGPHDANGRTTYLLDIWIHNGVDKTYSLGCSLMKDCTAEELHLDSSARSPTPTPEDQGDVDSDGEQTSNNEAEASTVFRVLSQPAYPAYIAYQRRLESFALWTFHHIAAPMYLALAGFFYAGYGDCVRCFQCGLGLRSWKVGDNVYDQHQKHRPHCPFLQAQLRAGAPTTDTTHQAQTAGTDSVEEGNTVESSGNNEKSSKRVNIKLTDTFNSSSHMIHKQQAVVGFTLGDQPTNMSIVSHTTRQSSSQESLKLKLLEHENTKLQVQLLCKVCFQAPCRDLFLPCGELYACTDCSKLLTHCPSCSRQILATITTYLT